MVRKRTMNERNEKAEGVHLYLHAEIRMPESQQYPLNLYLINDVKDIAVILGLKLFISDNSHNGFLQ